ncbi:MAG: fasciclin domain-containing protein [Bacteroidaceae bacterium]|nr:fasciclin domain-containing protein [Bacteroidaceae bacterium]
MKQIKFKTMIMAAIATIALSGCKDYIDEGSRYTFTGHTVASFLEENEEVFSSFIEILHRGGRLSLMKAYGQYTCFAPTNDAVSRYLFEQDSIYWASVEANKLDPSNDIIWTGVTSPELSELSDSMCKVISQTHLLPAIYLTTDMEGDVIPTMNMNDRYLSLSFGVDEVTQLSQLFINGDGLIIAKDEEVENGVVHTLGRVLNPSTNTIPSQIKKHEYFHIFSEALEATGYDDKLQLYKDDSYTDGDKTEQNIDRSGERSPYPKNRYYGYTAFVEPDRVFNEAGIYSFEDLEERCKEWYPHNGETIDHTAPLDDPKNPVNQFVGYHLLDRKLAYSRLVCYKIVVTGYFESEKDLQSNSDRNEYYETFSGRLMKVTMPRTVPSLSNSILINFSKATADASEEQLACMNVVINEPDAFRDSDSLYVDFNGEALNGTIHTIDKILIYDENVMAGRVLNGIIRIDCSSLCSELTNNDIRWKHPGNRSTGDVYIPNNYCKNMRAKSEESMVYYLSAHTSWSNYQGDEMMTLGAFDFEYKLPPVPAGTYEIRMGYSANSKRHIVQYYIDDEVTGIPVDMRLLGNSPLIDWVKDSDTEDNGVANDKAMKNRGYLKGPTTFSNYGEYTAGKARDDNSTFRKVITTKYLSEGEHWIRFKNVNENDDGTAQFMHDYIEIVPMTFIRDESLSLEEKRK